MEKQKKDKWEKPKVYGLGALDDGVGHCQTGSSAEPLVCHNGEQTSGTGIGHLCQNGGIAGPTAGDCTTGTTPGVIPESSGI